MAELSLTVKESLYLYSPKVTLGPLKATVDVAPGENELDTPALKGGAGTLVWMTFTSFKWHNTQTTKNIPCVNKTAKSKPNP